MIDEAGILRQIDDATQHVTSIFPSDTNLTCTLASPATAHLWSAWTEIVDSAVTKLSAAFATTPGHFSSMIVETVSDDTALYMYEIAWGAAKNILTRGRFAGAGKFMAAHIQDRFWSPPSQAGQLVYYRLKTDQAVADTCTIHIRYHLH